MMSRMQVTLDTETQRQARKRAQDRGLSLAEYVRRLVVRDLGQVPQTANPAAVFDLGDSGGSNIAQHKDRMLGEAFGSRKPKKRAR